MQRVDMQRVGSQRSGVLFGGAVPRHLLAQVLLAGHVPSSHRPTHVPSSHRPPHIALLTSPSSHCPLKAAFRAHHSPHSPPSLRAYRVCLSLHSTPPHSPLPLGPSFPSAPRPLIPLCPSAPHFPLPLGPSFPSAPRPLISLCPSAPHSPTAPRPLIPLCPSAPHSPLPRCPSAPLAVCAPHPRPPCPLPPPLQRYGFTFPLTLTAIHFALSFVGAFTAIEVSCAFTAIEILQVCPKAAVEAGEMVAWVMPMAVVTCFNVVLGQLSLRYVPLPALLSTKALSPGLTVAIQALALQADYDWRLCLSLLPVMAGAMLAYAPSVHFALPTFLSALCCVVLGCATVICAEVLLKGKQYSLDSLNALYQLVPYSALILAPPAAVLEGWQLWGWFVAQANPWPAVIAILISGCFAFCLNFSLFYTIQKTSALTFNVAGNLKLVITLVFSWLLFRTPMAPISLLGCLLELVGVVCYGWAIFSLRKRQVEIMRSPSAQVRVEQEASDDIVQVYLGAMLLPTLQMASAEVIRVSECKAAVVARLRNLDAAEWGMLWENAAAADEEEEEPLEQVPHSAPFSLSSPIMAGAAGTISARRSWAWREKVRSFGRQFLPRRGSCDDLNVAITTVTVTQAKRAKSFPESNERGNEKGPRAGRSRRVDSRGVWRSVYEPRWLEEGLAETSGDHERRAHGVIRDGMGVRDDTAQRAADARAVAGGEGSARYQLLRHNSLPCACASQKVSPTLPRRASAMHVDGSAEHSARSVAGAKEQLPSSSSSSQHRRTPSLLVIPPFLPSCLPSPSPVAAPCRTAPATPSPLTNTLRNDFATASECSPTDGCRDADGSPAASAGSGGGKRSSGAKRDGRTTRRSPAEGRTLSSGTPTEGGQSGAKWRSASIMATPRLTARPPSPFVPAGKSGLCCKCHVARVYALMVFISLLALMLFLLVPWAASHGAIRATAGDAVAVAEAGSGGRVRGRGRGPQRERGESLHFGGNGGIAESAMRMGGEQADMIQAKAVTMADAADAEASSETAFKGDEASMGGTGAGEEMEEGEERGTDGGEAEGNGEAGQGGEGEERGGGGGEVPMPLRHTPFLLFLSPAPMPPHAMRHCERPPYPPPPFPPRPPFPHTLPSISPFSPHVPSTATVALCEPVQVAVRHGMAADWQIKSNSLRPRADGDVVGGVVQDDGWVEDGQGEGGGGGGGGGGDGSVQVPQFVEGFGVHIEQYAAEYWLTLSLLAGGLPSVQRVRRAEDAHIIFVPAFSSAFYATQMKTVSMEKASWLASCVLASCVLASCVLASCVLLVRLFPPSPTSASACFSPPSLPPQGSNERRRRAGDTRIPEEQHVLAAVTQHALWGDGGGQGGGASQGAEGQQGEGELLEKVEVETGEGSPGGGGAGEAGGSSRRRLLRALRGRRKGKESGAGEQAQNAHVEGQQGPDGGAGGAERGDAAEKLQSEGGKGSLASRRGDFLIPAVHPHALSTVRHELAAAHLLMVDFSQPAEQVAHLDKDVLVPYSALIPPFLNDSLPGETKGGQGRVGGAEAGGAMRVQLARLLANVSGADIAEGSPLQGGVQAATAGMRSSKFCLVPEGDTASSCRLFDAILSHCIPLVVSDSLDLPFEEALDYTAFALFLPQALALRPGYVEAFLRNVSHESAYAMWQRLKEVAHHFVYSTPPKPGGAEDMIWQAVARRWAGDHYGRRYNRENQRRRRRVMEQLLEREGLSAADIVVRPRALPLM
ncbi:unnamed protein product [Closterium sp. Yama58-4]|nr:unnamed protein product [Closterium sp. Yama58-4]